MVTLILFLILSAGLQVRASNLDTAFKDFLTSSSSSKLYQDHSAVVNKLYKLFKSKFHRSSMTSTEKNIRFAAFNDTVHTLLKDYQQGYKTYTVGINEFTDWTADELETLRGLRIPQGKISSTNAKPNQRLLTLDGKDIETKASVLPSSYDLTKLVVAGTNTPILTPIKNQGQCGSCYAFAFIALLEAQYAFQLKTSADLSEQQIVDCSTKDYGCNGGYFTSTFAYLTANTYQVNSELSYPYKGKVTHCAFKSVGGGGVKFGSLVYRNVAAKDTNAIQQALTSYGPLWVTLFVGNQSAATFKTISAAFNSYTGGIFQPTGCLTSNLISNHAVVIVGYGVDATTNLPYWKVRNSWGNWGEQGYFRIKRGVNMCGIESAVYFIAKPA